MLRTSPHSRSLPEPVRALLKKLQGEGVGAVLARGVAGGFSVNILGALIGLVAQAVLARLMGGEQYGIYAYVFTWLSVLSLAAKLGFDTTLLRYVAAYKAKQQWSLLRGLLIRTNQMVVVLSIATGVVTAIVVELLSDRLSSDLVRTFWVLCLILPLSSLCSLRSAALRALRKVVLARLPDEVLRPTLLACLAAGCYFVFSIEVNALLAMVLQSVALLAAFFIGAYWMRLAMPDEVFQSAPEYENREWIRYAVPLVLFSAMNVILQRIDTLMLGAFLDTTSAGYYSVAVRIAKLMAFGLAAVNMIAAPMISSLYAQENMEELQRMLRLSALGIMAYTIPVTAGMILFGNYLLLIFGEEFVAAYPALVILALGQMINALAGSSGYVMTMTGHQNIALKIMSISAVVNILLNWLLIPRYGMNGAAWATALSLVGWNVAFVVYARRKIGLRTTVL
ncbi:MAG: flippase [Bdellovibrionales bacterium]|nr:flippase [Bdellovibrionales bacterium]